MTDDERLRFEYEQAWALVRMLSEVRFKLLAFVPTIAGAAVAFLSGDVHRHTRLAVGLVGAVATLGVFLYEARNTQHYGRALEQLRGLEQQLGLSLLALPPPPRAAGVKLGQRFGLGVVYAAALAAWLYLVVWALLALAEIGEPKSLGGIVGSVAAVAIVAFLFRRFR